MFRIKREKNLSFTFGYPTPTLYYHTPTSWTTTTTLYYYFIILFSLSLFISYIPPSPTPSINLILHFFFCIHIFGFVCGICLRQQKHGTRVVKVYRSFLFLCLRFSKLARGKRKRKWRRIVEEMKWWRMRRMKDEEENERVSEANERLKEIVCWC